MTHITHFKYNANRLELTFFFEDHSILMCKPIPHVVHNSLKTHHDLTAFYHKYIEHNLNFSKLCIH